MRNNKIDGSKINIPIVSYTNEPTEDPTWTSLYGNVLHPDFSHPCFFRHNGSNLNLFNLYNGETVYIVARGPSISTHLEDKETKDLLLHPSIVRYGMNTSPEVVDYNVNLWSGVDKMSKFQEQIFKNPNIMKFVPMNRFQVMNDGSDSAQRGKSIAYKNKYVCHCPNTVGVQSCLLEQQPKGQMSFSSAYLGTTAALYGYHKGMKSVLLFTLKICILLGFKKIVLLGVDFNMNPAEPYYKNTAKDYQKNHIDHNNKLYSTLAPIIKGIYKSLDSGESGYNTKIVTATPIESMSFIETINLKEELEKEIESKS